MKPPIMGFAAKNVLRVEVTLGEFPTESCFVSVGWYRIHRPLPGNKVREEVLR